MPKNPELKGNIKQDTDLLNKKTDTEETGAGEEEQKQEQDEVDYWLVNEFINADTMKWPDMIKEIPASQHNDLAQKLIKAGSLEANQVGYHLNIFEGIDHKEIAKKMIEAERGFELILQLKHFKGLDNEIAQKLIEAGIIEGFIIHINNFEGIDHNQIAKKIIDAGKGEALVKWLEKFSGLDNETAQQLIEAGEGHGVAFHLEKFSGLDNETAQQLIKAGEGSVLYKNPDKFQELDYNQTLQNLIKYDDSIMDLEKFSGLDNETAQQLIKAGKGSEVAYNLKKFEGLDHKQIAQQLIKAGKGSDVAFELEKFQGIDHNEIAQQLIKFNEGQSVASNLEKFQGIDHNEIAQQLIKAGKADYIPINFDKFIGLDNETAQQLIEAGRGWDVIKNLEKFQGIDHNQFAQQMIELGKGSDVAYKLNKFEGLDHKEFAQQLIDIGEAKAVAQCINNFEGLNENIFKQLIDAGEARELTNHEIKLEDIDNTEIARQLIDAGEGWSVAEHIDNFQGLDHNQIAQQLIRTGLGRAVARNLDDFQGLDHNQIAQQLIDLGKLDEVGENIERFEILSNHIAQQMIVNGWGKTVIKNLDKFTGLDNQTALYLIEAGEGVRMSQYLDKFTGLDNQTALKLIEADQEYNVCAKLEKFTGLDKKVFEDLKNKGKFTNILENLDSFSESTKAEYFLDLYKKDLALLSEHIYDKYFKLKQNGDEIQVMGFIEKIKEQIGDLISSKEQGEEVTEQENYKELIEVVYPNHASSWTNYESNESCTDRSADLNRFKIREVYEIDLSEGIEMELKPGQEKNEQNISELEQPVASIQSRFTEVGFEKEKMMEILDKDLEIKIDKLPNKEIFKTREEKIYALLLESLVDRFDAKELKELLIGYQFAEFEDIKTYLEGTRGRAEQAKNPDYAYLLELKEFFADHVKEVERKIAKEAQANPDINKLLPNYYQEKNTLETSAQRQDQINKLQIDKLGLKGNLLERIMKELNRKTDKKGNPLKLGEFNENNEFQLGKKGQGIAGMIMGEQKRAAKAIRKLFNKEIDPESIHLGELNLEEYMEAEEKIKSGEYDEELFSRYLIQAFQGVFEKEMSIIDKELSKYQPPSEADKDKQQRELECFITKNHTSAHARGVGGVCVSGDNPSQGEKNQWDMPNYFQMVLRDKDNKICQGLVLLHYYEDQGKKILTAAFDPSSTYLYKVNETQLFNGLLKQLSKFAQDNDIDTIEVTQNKTMRTNRTGGEFERAMEKSIRKQDQQHHLSQQEVFSYKPEYKQKDLDVIWQKK